MKANRVFAVYLMVLTIGILAGMHYAHGSPLIWTDKPNYSPGDTAIISGSGFLAYTTVNITITYPDLSVHKIYAWTDWSGAFNCPYPLNGITGTYKVTATDGTNTATTTFTDAPLVVDFKQYATKDDQWINSILQSSNSMYHEGMSVPQRTVFTNIASTSGNVHTLTLSHEATKGGIHAYDWLTGWNQGNIPPLSFVPWGPSIGPPGNLGTICQTLHNAPGSGAYEIFVDVPDDSFISKDGSTQTRINAYETVYGNRQIRICGNLPFTSASLSLSHDVPNGGDTGDSFILYTLMWKSASDQILIEMAGHLAMSGDPGINPIAWGVGLGASQVGGGPYHFKLHMLDGGSLGSQDNQIMGTDIFIAPGHIVVHKATVPSGDPADFTFDPDYQLSNFVLPDGEQYDSGDVAPGTYHVQELALAGWDLTAMSITDPSGGSSYVLGTGTATIDLAAGETVHVYYTNTKRSKIIVDKITVPSGSFQSFTFTPSYGSAFALTDAGTPVDSGWLVPGTYSVTETVPSGWDLTSVTVNGAASSNGASFTLNAGEIIWVNFTDTQRGKIIVDEITVPSGSLQSFSFSTTGSGYSGFGLTDAADPNDSGWLVPGTYTVTEIVPTGWILTGVTKDGVAFTNGGNIVLGAGQIVYVNFTNTQRSKIIVDKVTIPSGSSQSFSFSLTGGPDALNVPFSLTDAAAPYDSDWIKPGTYAVAETVPTGWDLTNVLVSDASPVGAISLEAGETVTVTLTDTQRGHIVVHKTTVPVGDPAVFTFDPDYQLSNFVLPDGQHYDSGAVVPGTYHVQELALAGWDLTGLTVTDPSGGSSTDLGTGTATIDLAAGETVHVYYTNTVKAPPGTGNIIVEKITLGGVDTFDFVGADTTLPPGFSSFSITTVTSGVGASTGFTSVNPGTYTVTEQALTGWDLTGITINDPDGESSLTGSTAILDVDSGETVTVTFTNIKRGRIVVDKITVPAADPQSFSFSLTGGPDPISQSFSLTDTAAPYDSGNIKPGTYSVSETVVPLGWDLTEIRVNGVIVPNANSITVNAGQIVYVNFTDTKRGRIIVDKITDPAHSSQSFTFTTTGSGYSGFGLTDDAAPNDSGWLVPGTYTVTEGAVTGWDLTSVTVNGAASSNGASISLAAGQIRYVNFTNTQRSKIIVDKVTVPGADPQGFGFSLTGGPDGINQLFSLTDAATPHDSGWIKPGTYAASETVPAGWSLTSAVCTDGSPVSAIVLDPGETVTVTFTNTKSVPPTRCIISDFVWKDLDHDGIQDAGEPGLPGVTVNLYDSLGNLVATTTTNGNGLYSFTVDPGSYYLEFVPPPGYVLTRQYQGTDDAKDSDPDPTTHKTAIFTVTSGQTDSTRDAGMYARPPVGGEWIPVGKFSLLAPWISLGSFTALIIASFVYVKRKKKQMS